MKLSKQSIEKQNGGTWIDYEGPIRLKLARLGNDAYKKLSDEENQRNRERKEKDEPTLPWDEILTKLLAYTVLLGWQNVDGEDDKPLSYTPEIGLKYLSDARYSDLREFVLVQSNRRAHFIEKAEETAEKNS